MHRAIVAFAALLVACVLPAAAGAASLPAGTTAVLSGTPDLTALFATPASSATIGRAQGLNADGTKVVFSSTADALFAGDDDNVRNIYVADLTSGAIELVSRATGIAGEPAHTACTNAVISDDGTSVAFTCTGALDPVDTNDVRDVYVRNLVQHTTTLVSRATDGTLGDFTSDRPTIDAQGRFIAFDSAASTFAADTDGVRAIFRKDIATGAIELVSRPTDPADSPGQGADASISDDGQRIAFATFTPLDPADQNNRTDVYVRTLGGATPVTTLLSRADGAAGASGNQLSRNPLISGDGRRVIFDSLSTNLDAADVDTGQNVYSRRLDTDETSLLGRPDSGAFALSIGTNGVTSRALLTRGDGTVALVDESTGATRGLDVRASAAAISGNGAKIALGADRGLTADVPADLASVLVEDLATGARRTVSRPPGNVPFANEGGSALFGAISADSRYVVFDSSAPALGRAFGLAAGQLGVYRRDLASGELALVSRVDGPAGGPLQLAAVSNRGATDPQIDADGTRIAFAARVPGETRERIYLRDVVSGRTLSADAGDRVAENFPQDLTISDDGTRVAFATPASLVPEDAGGAQSDVYAFDFAANRMILVSRASGPQGAAANDFSNAPSISGDGHSVAFRSSANNLTPVDLNFTDHIFVRNIDAGTTTHVSVTGAGAPADNVSNAPSISRDGNRVAFGSTANNLGSSEPQLYVRDIAAGTTTIASRADGPTGAPVTGLDGFEGGLLSADGQHVTFTAAPTAPIAPGAPGDGFPRIYERDLADGVTRLISRRTGNDGAPSDGLDLAFIPRAITAAGECVLFSASGSLLTPRGNADFTNLFVRAVRADCGFRVQPGPGPAPTVKPAVLSRLKLKPARFFVGGRKGGTKILFRLDKRSAVTLRFDRLLAGHRANAKGAKGKKGRKGKVGRCLVKARKGKRCTVTKLAGRLTIAASRTRGGANTITFSGKVGRKALKPGRYRLTATPLKGKARTLRFVVVKAPKAKKQTSAKGKARR